MAGSAFDNRLIVPILGLLVEAPRHLYALTQNLQARIPDRGITITRGSVRNLLVTLTRGGFVHVIGEERVGNRPPRTVYTLTEKGTEELRQRVKYQLADVSLDHDHFTQAVAYLGLLDLRETVNLLDKRRADLLEQVLQAEIAYRLALAERVPELFVLEADFIRHQMEAEARWIETCITRLQTGDLPWSGSERGRS